MAYVPQSTTKNTHKNFTDDPRLSDCPNAKNNFQTTSVNSLQNRCQILEHILSYCEISPMPRIINDFKSMSDFYLHQLAKEVAIYRLSSEERSQLLDFLDYLRSTTREIEDMLFIHR
ncbi:MAG: hypothetical protein IK062_07190 [Selenomonadaceae bacterium]|nr:hypothetical protein [Selenomonadaceae bacterium]